MREESAHLYDAFKVPINVLDNYILYNPELEFLRRQDPQIREALNATKAHSDAVTEQLGVLQAQLLTLRSENKVNKEFLKDASQEIIIYQQKLKRFIGNSLKKLRSIVRLLLGS